MLGCAAFCVRLEFMEFTVRIMGIERIDGLRYPMFMLLVGDYLLYDTYNPGVSLHVIKYAREDNKKQPGLS